MANFLDARFYAIDRLVARHGKYIVTHSFKGLGKTQFVSTQGFRVVWVYPKPGWPPEGPSGILWVHQGQLNTGLFFSLQVMVIWLACWFLLQKAYYVTI